MRNMADNDWKKRLGMVYSTNPDFKFETLEDEAPQTLEPSRQRLTVRIDRKGRAGKQVTLVEGFVGADDDLADLARTLKQRLGVGGTAKDGVVAVQGDWRDRIVSILKELGYRAGRGN